MENIRKELYAQIEKLEAQLKALAAAIGDEYGMANSPEALIIGAKIDDLEAEISETWIQQ